MAAERIIGVDLGTSTSVIRVKRYQDGKPLGNRLDTQAVVFNMGSTMVPTVIKRQKGVAYYGEDALAVNAKGAVVHQGFKVDLESPVELQKAEARALTEEFLSYLAKVYKEQSEGGHLGEADDRERTIVSYPVKWSEETKNFMIEAAQKAGFPNVEGMDEAQAAIHAVTNQSKAYLTQRGYLKPGVPCNILLIDMGAGTTDLVLCRYTSGENPKNEILCTWPKRGDILFGGQEVEGILRSYVRSLMEETQADQILSNCPDSKFKAWKEFVVSPALAKGDTVNSFGELDMIADLLGIDMAPYDLDRRKFEAWAKEYLKKFSQLIRGCIGEAGIDKNQIELVILTGGHSQWYFVKEILAGRLAVSETNDVLLPQICRDTGRIIPISRPQETVALGLVYSPLDIGWGGKPEKTKKAEKKETHKESKQTWTENKQTWTKKYMGIDFSEAGTRMGICTFNGKEMISSQEGQYDIPPFITRSHMGQWLVGEAACRYAKETGRELIAVHECLKNGEKIRIGNQYYQAREVIARFFGRLLQDEKARWSVGGQDAEYRAYLVVPYNYNAIQEYLLRSAMKQAGWSSVRFVNRSSMVAVCYEKAYDYKNKEERLLICHVGEETLELGVFDWGDMILEELVVTEDRKLGVKAIQEQLAEYIARALEWQEGVSLHENTGFMQQAAQEARRVRKILERGENAEVRIRNVETANGERKDLKWVLSSKDYEKVIEGLHVRQGLKSKVSFLLECCGFGISDLNRILLSGETGAHPHMAQWLEALTGQPVICLNDEKYGPASGVAEYTRQIGDIVIFQVTRWSYFCAGSEYIGQYTTIPCRKGIEKDKFKLPVEFPVVQKSLEAPDEEIILGKYRIEDVKDKQSQIEMVMHVDTDGIFCMRAYIEGSKEAVPVTVLHENIPVFKE